MTDPRYPGTGNYVDWLWSLPIDEWTPTNTDEIIEEMRKRHRAYQSGVKIKKHEDVKPVDLKLIGLVEESKSNWKRKL